MAKPTKEEIERFCVGDKSLYNEYNAGLSPDKEELDDKVNKFASEIFEQFCGKGYNPREISHYIIGSILNKESEIVLLKAAKMRRLAKNALKEGEEE